MATRNNIGKTIMFSEVLPATNDVAGYEALTWTELDYPQSLPQFGVSHANIDVEDLKTGFTGGVKGAGSGVESQGSCRIDSSTLTPAQEAFRLICDSAGGDIALKIISGSGVDNAPTEGDQVEYAQGYVGSYQENQATVTSHEGFVYSFKQNAPTVKSTEPA